MRAYRFRALTFESARVALAAELPTEVVPAATLAAAAQQECEWRREGIATVKIDRLKLRRGRQLRVLVAMLGLALFLLWLLT